MCVIKKTQLTIVMMVCFGDCNICWIISAPLCLINCFKMMNECLHVTDKWQTPTCPRTQSDLIMLFETDFSLKNESRCRFSSIPSSRNGVAWRVWVNLPNWHGASCKCSQCVSVVCVFIFSKQLPSAVKNKTMSRKTIKQIQDGSCSDKSEAILAYGLLLNWRG